MDEHRLDLPEESHFTVEEVAQQWQCSTKRVMHYIEEGLLRPAIRSSELWGVGLFDCEAAAKIAEEQGLRFTEGDWFPVREPPSESVVGVIWSAPFHEIDNSFFYIQSTNIFPFREQLVLSILEDFHGRKFGLVDIGSEEAIVKFDVTDLILRGYRAPHSNRSMQFQWNEQKVIVTREERDRFVRANLQNPPVRENRSTYKTPYLEVMDMAIKNFFLPRREVDAKSDEIVEWIASRLSSVGLEGSKRIAHAMFTIIKPADHNPRKRRV